MRPLKSGRWATPSLRPKKVSVEKEFPRLKEDRVMQLMRPYIEM